MIEMNEKILKMIDNFKNAKILVVGDIMLDKYVKGDVERISPEAPVQVVSVKKEEYILGGAANVCNNLAALGCKTSMCGIIGTDDAGKKVISLLSKGKIEKSLVFSEKTRKTTQKIRVVSQGQQLLRIDYESTYIIDINLQKKYLLYLKNKIKDYDIVVISDYNKGFLTKNIVEMIVDKHSKVLIDPKPEHKNFFKEAYLITPNLKEASMMAGMEIRNENNITAIGKQLLKEMDSYILITCGGK